jgi:hypothetical protein
VRSNFHLLTGHHLTNDRENRTETPGKLRFPARRSDDRPAGRVPSAHRARSRRGGPQNGSYGRLSGAALRRALAERIAAQPPSPFRLEPVENRRNRTDGLCRRVLTDTEPVAWIQILARNGRVHIVPACLKCCPRWWLRRCERRTCAWCGRPFYVLLLGAIGTHRYRACCLPICTTRRAQGRKGRERVEEGAR